MNHPTNHLHKGHLHNFFLYLKGNQYNFFSFMEIWIDVLYTDNKKLITVDHS